MSIKMHHYGQSFIWGIQVTLLIKFYASLFTGGADKLVKLWELGSKMCVQEYRGHNDVVRDVKIATPDTFYSASNDW